MTDIPYRPSAHDPDKPVVAGGELAAQRGEASQVSGDPRWIAAVLGHGGGSTPAVVLQPRDQATHDQVAVRLRRGGWTRVSAAEWNRQAWPLAPAGAVDVVGGVLVRFTTGAASVYAAEDLAVTPMWTSAARERRALVALVPPDAFTDEEYEPEAAGGVLGQLAAARRLHAGLCAVRFDVFTGPRPR